MKESVNHPNHYYRNGMDVATIGEAWELEHHEFTALEYLMRAEFKEHRVQDLCKAAWWIIRKIRLLEETWAERSPFKLKEQSAEERSAIEGLRIAFQEMLGKEGFPRKKDYVSHSKNCKTCSESAECKDQWETDNFAKAQGCMKWVNPDGSIIYLPRDISHCDKEFEPLIAFSYKGHMSTIEVKQGTLMQEYQRLRGIGANIRFVGTKEGYEQYKQGNEEEIKVLREPSKPEEMVLCDQCGCGCSAVRR